MKRISWFSVLVAVTAAFVGWTILNRFGIDPGFADFLERKTGLDRPLRVPVWLRVLDVHIAFACLAMIAGVANFANGKSPHRRKLHRMAGYVYAFSVLAVALTSGYMAPYATGGKAVGMAFNLLNVVWLFATAMAVIYARGKKIDKHRRWMIRSYAFCFTNLGTHVMLWAFVGLLGLNYDTGYAVSVIGTIVSLFLAAELVIRLRPRS